MSVSYVQDAMSGDASLSCVACGQAVQLLAGPDDAGMTSFVTEHRACEPQPGQTCDVCVQEHDCWTCEDEETCHRTAVRRAADAEAAAVEAGGGRT